MLEAEVELYRKQLLRMCDHLGYGHKMVNAICDDWLRLKESNDSWQDAINKVKEERDGFGIR